MRQEFREALAVVLTAGLLAPSFAVEDVAVMGIRARPARDAAAPVLGHLREDVQAGTSIFAALGVMRGGGEHGGGPMPQAATAATSARMNGTVS